MTFREMITFAKELRPHSFSDALLYHWLTELDGKLAAAVFLMAPAEYIQRKGVFPDALDNEPLVEYPHQEMYIQYLMAMLDLSLGENEQYQNDMAVFNKSYSDFVVWFANRYNPGKGYGKGCRCGCGPDGNPPYYLTAYGLAVQQGFEGSLQEWLASLHGASVELQVVESEMQFRTVSQNGEPGQWITICDLRAYAPDFYAELDDVSGRIDLCEKANQEILQKLENQHLLIRVYADGDGFAADKTIDDIQTADQDNIPCWCNYNGGYLPHTRTEDAVAYFSGVLFGKEIRVVIGDTVTVTETALEADIPYFDLVALGLPDVPLSGGSVSITGKDFSEICGALDKGPVKLTIPVDMGNETIQPVDFVIEAASVSGAYSSTTPIYYSGMRFLCVTVDAENISVGISTHSDVSGIPAVTADDEGKILRVLDNAYVLVDMPESAGSADLSAMPEGVAGDGVTDDAAAIQALLDTKDFVYLPKGTYYIVSAPLKMNRDHVKFVCDGTLLVNTTNALTLSASYCHVKIAHIKARWNGSYSSADVAWTFTCSGIKFEASSASVMYNTVEVDYIERCIHGFWFVPSGESKGVAHNTVKFGEVFAEKGISFNPGSADYVFINANYFWGGKLRGNHAVYTEKGAGQTDPFNGNFFYHLAMEKCTKPITLNCFCYNNFRDLRLTQTENSDITHPDPLIVFDGESFGNKVETHGNFNVDQVVDTEKTSSWTWAKYMGNEYNAPGIVCGEQTEETFLGYKARSSFGQFIIPNAMRQPFEGYNKGIDLSDSNYAIEGGVYYCTANTADVVIKLPQGYRVNGAQTLFVYVAGITDPYTVQVTQYDEEAGADVVIAPSSAFPEVGMYKLECHAAVGWIVTRVGADLPESGGSEETTETAIFPLQEVSGFADGQAAITPAPFTLVEGEEYRVVFDGVEYNLVCQSLEAGAFLLLTNTEITEAGEPVSDTYIMASYIPSEDLVIFGSMISGAGDPATSHTIGIYQTVTAPALPAVSSADNGKILQVVDGAWAAVAVADSAVKTYVDDYINSALEGDY